MYLDYKQLQTGVPHLHMLQTTRTYQLFIPTYFYIWSHVIELYYVKNSMILNE